MERKLPRGGWPAASSYLPEAFTSDPDRLARFEREAKVLASLNHPNIGSIYGLEEAEGGKFRALVLELVEGPTLADRIKQGPIPIDEALPIAKQIAEALEAAHEQGVIHRDLKPANIKVKDDGTVKVLDFGLAKAFQPDASSPNMSMSPTISLTAAATQMGMVIGTAAYMSPEQAKGKQVSKSADVWAFGAVLFEMLTGKTPFTADDVSEMLVSVIRDDPDWSELPNDTPASAHQTLRVCLQKDPKQRVRDMSAIRMALGGAFEMPLGTRSEPLSAPRLGIWQRPIPAAIFALVIAGVAGLAAWTATRPDVAPAGLIRFAIALPETLVFGALGLPRDLAISPDGTHIVYNAFVPGGVRQLHLRSIDQLDSAPLPGGEGLAPFFSPDGEWVGFLDVSLTTLQKVLVSGGPPVMLAETSSPIFGASWGDNDQIVFAPANEGLFSVSGSGGEPQRLTKQDAEMGEAFHAWPSFIPDRDAIVFVIGTGPSQTPGELAVLDLDTGEVTELGLAGVGPHYVSTGHLVYATYDGSLRAVAFDTTSLSVTGNPVPLEDGVMVKPSGAANFSISDNGRLVYVPGTQGSSALALGGLVLVDRTGDATPFTSEQRDYFRPRVSPDGTRVAVEVTERRGNDVATHIWLVAVETGVATQFTFDGSRNQFPLWTADAETVVFRSDRASERGWGIYRKAADGTGQATLVLQDEGAVVPTDLSGDGVLLFHKPGQGGPDDIWTIGLDEDGPATEFLSTPDEERAARFSPDGRWVAYQLDTGDGPQVHVRPYPRTAGSQWRISEEAGRAPFWSPDGQSLYFAGLFPVPLHVASIQTGSGFVRGRPEELFVIDDNGFRTGPEIFVGPLWDITPDGQRFVMVRTNTGDDEGNRVRQINVVINWFEELKARVPIP